MGRSQNVYFAFVAFTLLFFFGKSAPIDRPPASTLASNLQVSIRQAGDHALALGITNTGAVPLTLLTWNSPLDPLAVRLGLVAFTPDGAAEPVHIDTVQVRRKMPPERDSLVTGERGGVERAVRAWERLRGKEVTVVCRGTWMGPWDADEFGMEDLERIGSTQGMQFGGFEVVLESVGL
ncbi:hypothetical protein PG994_007110 [Apiospora phragmitis]|uniref:Uncharacterized protein n=1 Tax=Apiospora phragmitis TaxID=2905665 RepID=A0ABR1UZW3_9PEZI